MASEIRVPTLGESVTEATIGQWLKQPGEPVKADEPLVELETDKVSMEVPAPADGTLDSIVAQAGETVEVDALLAMFNEGGEIAIFRRTGLTPVFFGEALNSVLVDRLNRLRHQGAGISSMVAGLWTERASATMMLRLGEVKRSEHGTQRATHQAT